MNPISKSQLKRITAQVGGDWQLYHAMKEVWERDNPEATPEQYQKKMKELADKTGV